MLKWYYEGRMLMKKGASIFKYREIFKEDPEAKWVEPLVGSDDVEFMNYMRHKQIQNAKRKVT